MQRCWEMCSTKAGISIITLHVKITSLDQFWANFVTQLTVSFTCPADVPEKCRPGLHTPVPAGFYLNDVWTSFVCSTRHFTTQTTTECLKDKHIYMMGDSTMRQWFEFFVKEVPSEITSCLLFIYTYKIVICGINGIIFVGVTVFQPWSRWTCTSNISQGRS